VIVTTRTTSGSLFDRRTKVTDPARQNQSLSSPTAILCAIPYGPHQILSLSCFLLKDNDYEYRNRTSTGTCDGILILLVPRFLNYFVAVYLIAVGVLGLMHHGLTWEDNPKDQRHAVWE